MELCADIFVLWLRLLRNCCNCKEEYSLDNPAGALGKIFFSNCLPKKNFPSSAHQRVKDQDINAPMCQRVNASTSQGSAHQRANASRINTSMRQCNLISITKDQHANAQCVNELRAKDQCAKDQQFSSSKINSSRNKDYHCQESTHQRLTISIA